MLSSICSKSRIAIETKKPQNKLIVSQVTYIRRDSVMDSLLIYVYIYYNTYIQTAQTEQQIMNIYIYIYIYSLNAKTL